MSWKRREVKGRPGVSWAMACDLCGRETAVERNKADATPGWADYFVEHQRDVSQKHYCPLCEPRVTETLKKLKPKAEVKA